MSKKSKTSLIIIGLFITIAMVVGVSYAIWSITLQQKSTNVITTGCFEVTFTDANPINLSESYPISDEEGKALTPYEFTITNTCNSNASYQINLETLNDSTLTDLSVIKMLLNKKDSTGTSKMLTSNEMATKTLENASSAYKLEVGYLKALESKTYNLRLWLSEDTLADEIYMNKNFSSKVTIITSYVNELDEEAPVANIVTHRTTSGVTVDASSSRDNKGIKTYYYSTDGVTFTSSTESTYFYEDPYEIQYGKATETLKELEKIDHKIKKVYLQVEDEAGNRSETISRNIEELFYDGTTDNNLRYAGANPSNYVDIGETYTEDLYYGYSDENSKDYYKSYSSLEECQQSSYINKGCEKIHSVGDAVLYRIMGGFNNMKTDTTDTESESRIKIIKFETYPFGVWDQNDDNQYGYNSWGSASSNYRLNNNYYGAFPTEVQQKIAATSWGIGAGSDKNISISEFYQQERNGSFWSGNIALPYISDYGYATSGGEEMDRETCINNPSKENYFYPKSSECAKNNYLLNKNYEQWVLNSDNSTSNHVFLVENGSILSNFAKPWMGGIKGGHPTFYLKEEIQIVSGEGSLKKPFVVQ